MKSDGNFSVVCYAEIGKWKPRGALIVPANNIRVREINRHALSRSDLNAWIKHTPIKIVRMHHAIPLQTARAILRAIEIEFPLLSDKHYGCNILYRGECHRFRSCTDAGPFCGLSGRQVRRNRYVSATVRGYLFV